MPFDVDGARLPCQVISESYARRSVIFTTNVEFSRWGTVFADDKLAAAIVDRVVHHGRLVEFGGIDPDHTERSLAGLDGYSYTRGSSRSTGTPGT